MKLKSHSTLVPTLAALALVLVAVVFPVGSAGAATSAAPAGATPGEPSVAVKRVDATGGKLVIDGWVTGADASDLKVQVDGRAVTPSSIRTDDQAGRTSDVVVVLDNAAAMGNASVQLSKKALAPLMPGGGAVDNLGLISTGGSVRIVQGPTSQAAALMTALVGIIPDGTSQTWAGVGRAAQILEGRGPNSAPAVVLIAGSPIQDAAGGMGPAVAALRSAGVELHVIGLGAGADLNALADAVADVGGTFRAVENDEGFADAVDGLSKQIGGRFTITSDGVTGDEVVPLTVSVGKQSAHVAFVPGAIRVGSSALSAMDLSAGGGGFFASPLVKWLAVLLGVVAAVSLFWAAISLVLPDEINIVKRLEHYEDPYGEKVETEVYSNESHATVPLIRKAVEITGDLANRRGLTENLEFKLEQASIPLRAAEGMFFAGATAIVLFIAVSALTRNVLFGLVAAAVAIMVPKALLDLKIRRQQKSFVAQLPDMLTLLAGTLRAGYSISQGFESVSREIDDPMGRELRRVVSEARLGRPLDEALESVAQRMESDDFAWAVMAIRIQREVGGNLAELLMTVAETMTQRERLRRDVMTLTAEGRMSAIVIGLLPPGLSVVLFVMNPEYIKQLFQPGLGYMLIGTAVVSMGIGFAWMKKTVAIEV